MDDFEPRAEVQAFELWRRDGTFYMTVWFESEANAHQIADRLDMMLEPGPVGVVRPE
ncbi:hypothetical protein G3N95_24320 [Paraburkholderia sp. Tr-20389]|uniref:hypothetical protein n=1 Tax=Paraburkholderia sp. Tr-20389 TaxID=2703903 RepID=UPI001981005D|nr:hypothetical protein [Paraburkholderia sp. Tr-20389]MBN3756088.1 hypothetical protein [Paraburkholderia sp. Tr-20389]